MLMLSPQTPVQITSPTASFEGSLQGAAVWLESLRPTSAVAYLPGRAAFNVAVPPLGSPGTALGILTAALVGGLRESCTLRMTSLAEVAALSPAALETIEAIQQSARNRVEERVLQVLSEEFRAAWNWRRAPNYDQFRGAWTQVIGDVCEEAARFLPGRAASSLFFNECERHADEVLHRWLLGADELHDVSVAAALTDKTVPEDIITTAARVRSGEDKSFSWEALLETPLGADRSLDPAASFGLIEEILAEAHEAGTRCAREACAKASENGVAALLWGDWSETALQSSRAASSCGKVADADALWASAGRALYGRAFVQAALDHCAALALRTRQERLASAERLHSISSVREEACPARPFGLDAAQTPGDLAEDLRACPAAALVDLSSLSLSDLRQLASETTAELLGRVGDEEAAELSRRMNAAMTKVLCRRISDDDDRQRRASRVAAVRSLLEALGVSSGQVADAAIDARLVANDSSNPVVAVTKELAASIGHRWETTAAGPSPSLQEKA